MKRGKFIDALLIKAKEQFTEIQAEYNESLNSQHVTDLLKVDIKNMCENIRSILDYLAHDIREKYCTSANPKDRFYFPILPDKNQFIRQVNKFYPGLETSNQAIYDFLETTQPYQTGFEWLGKFNKINNENKHGSLVEQTRTETVTRITATSNTGGGAVSWDPRSVKFGGSGSVFINGVPVNSATQMPVPSPNQTITKTVWVDFIFDGIQESALKLLEESINGVSSIYEDIKKNY